MYKLLLCLRYLRTRYIALASVVSVMLGVATMIVVNSVMAGFTSEMRTRIHGLLADVVVESRSMDGIPDAKAQMAIIDDAAGEFIEAMTPIVEVPGMAFYRDPETGAPYQLGVQLIGIEPEGKSQVGLVRDYLTNYQPTTKNGVVVGEPLRDWDEPVSFELTDEALAYRRNMKREQFRELEMDTGADTGIDLSTDTAANTEPDFVDSQSPFGTEEAASPEAVASTDGSTDASVSEDSTAQFDEGGFEMTFPSGDVPFDVTAPLQSNNQPTDPTAPAAARAFLGGQIAGYDVTDPETGERRRINLVQPGDDIILSTVRSSSPPEASSFTVTVADIFQSGMSEYDGNLVLMNIEELQKARGMMVNGVGAISAVQIKLKNYDDAEEVVTRLRAAFPMGTVNVSTWEDKQGLLLSAVEVETAILNVLLFMIIAVAGFGILAIFFMIVVEKTRDIGILKALGASSRGISSIFMTYGLGLGIVGSMAGVCLGLLFVRYINEIEAGLSWIRGRKVFDPDIYYFDGIPVSTSLWMVFWVATGAITIAVLASLLPARRASRLHPVRALRYE